LSQLARQLPRSEYCLAAVVHPNAFSWHGALQVCAWCGDAARSGLRLIAPEEGWRAVLAAADCLIGDDGSVTAYGAAIGLPVLFGSAPAGHVMPGSPIARLAAIAPQLSPEPFADQLDRVMDTWPRSVGPVTRASLTDVRGESARIIRRQMYQLMDLAEPPEPPAVDPVPAPGLIRFHWDQAGLEAAQ
jgi:hypothetical protein